MKRDDLVRGKSMETINVAFVIAKLDFVGIIE